MADVKWIKIVTDIFDNRKIKQIENLPDGDCIIVIWFKLLCLAGNVNDGGAVYFTKEIPYTDEMLAVEFNKPLTAVRMALSVFEGYKMIEVIDNVLYISSWEKYQNIEALSKLREQTRKRVANHRANREISECNANVTQCNADVTLDVTQCNATDIDKELDIDKNTRVLDKSRSKRFTPPSVDEVQAYCKERNNGIDANHFVDYYTANDWRVGKNKMKDWKAAVRTWEKNGFNKPSDKQKRPDYTDPSLYSNIKESDGFV